MNLTRYIIGYVLSILLTLAAFGLLELHIINGHLWPTHAELIPAFIGLALLQFFVQLFCFLHLGFKKQSLERLFILGGACLVVCILVGGSLWIMWSLNGRMMPNSQQEEQYMQMQGGF